MGMKLETLLKAVPAAAVRGSTACEIAGLACDSRKIRPGYLFIALPGEKTDGMVFIDDAFRRGAVAVMASRAEGGRREMTFIRVDDPRLAMALVAAAFHGHPARQLKVVGVTGTNGKTTVTFLVRDILAAAGCAPGLLGTVQYEIGDRIIPATRTTPESPDIQQMLAQMLDKRLQSVVMEVSSHALVQHRVAGIDFDVGIFTNLTRDHLDYHKTLDAYFAAKRRLFEELGKGAKLAWAVINRDDQRGRGLAALPGMAANVLTYGFADGADVVAYDVRLAADGSRCMVRTPAGGIELRLNLLGRHNIANALAALSAGLALGVDLSVIIESLARSQHVPGRLEAIPNNRGIHVFVDYAHTDDALANVLHTLREISGRRLLVVFGCGGNRDRTKRPLMGAVAAELADFFVLTSDNPRKEDPRSIIAEIEQGVVGRRNYAVEVDRAQAIRQALALAQPGDIILIAGKGHERYQEFADVIVPFDDRQVVSEMMA